MNRRTARLLARFLVRGTPAWKDIHNAADRYRPRLQRAAEAAFEKGKTALNIDALRAALRDKKEQEVFVLASDAIVTAANSLRSEMEEILGEVLASSGSAAARKLRKLLRLSDRRQLTTWSFDKTNPRAVEWVKEHAADTVTGVSETTREQIRKLVEDAFEEQFDVDDLADEIAELIGDEDRAENIARTETMKASNAGQQEAWNQAVDEGLLTGEEEQEWITTPDDRLCPICEPLDGQKAPIGGQFKTELGRVDGPPAHPRCRCTIALSV